MPKILPILAIGAAALLLGKKKKKKAASNDSVKALVEKTPLSGLEGKVIGEDALEEDLAPGGTVGEFEIQEESIDYDPEDDYEEVKKFTKHNIYEDMKNKCDKFIDAAHVVPTETGELPIHQLAVEQSILPAMRESAQGFAKSFGLPLDGESFGPKIVLAGLEAIAPECGWEFDENAQEFRYANHLHADGGRMGEVLGAMIDLSVNVLNEINQG